MTDDADRVRAIGMRMSETWDEATKEALREPLIVQKIARAMAGAMYHPRHAEKVWVDHITEARAAVAAFEGEILSLSADRLTAAAPDMFEALKAVRYNGASGLTVEVCEAVDNALAKAGFVLDHPAYPRFAVIPGGQDQQPTARARHPHPWSG